MPVRPDRALSVLFATVALACTTSPGEGPPDGMHPPGEPSVATIALQLTAVPSDVRCVRALVSGYEMVTRSVDVTAGAAGQVVNFPALPLGPATVYFDAFNVACAGVGPNTGPTWVAIQPLKLQLMAGQVAKVSMDLRRPTSLAGSLDFVDSPPMGVTLIRFDSTEVSGFVGRTVVSASTLLIANQSGASFTPGPITLSGDTSDFAIGVDDCKGRALAPAGVCSITVDFTPKSEGTKQCVVKSGGLYAIINGVALDPGDVFLSPTSLNFGTVAVGQQKVITVTVSNRSTLPFSTVPRSVFGDYDIAATTCRDALAPRDSCTIDVRFAPRTLTPFPGTLTVNSLEAELVGAGAGPGEVRFEPSFVDFGNVVLGETGQNFVHVSNHTNVPFPLALGLTGDTDFHFDGADCPSVLAPATGCDIVMSYTPRSADGSHVAQVVAGPGAGDALVSAGVIVPKVTLTPPSAAFGNVVLGARGLQTFTLTTDTTIQIDPGIGLPYTIFPGGTCGTSLGAGQSCTIAVAFFPRFTGVATSTLFIGEFLPRAQVTGTGVVAGSVTLSPATNNLGTLAVGQTSEATLTLSNMTAASFFPAFQLGGSNGSEFQRSGGTCGTSLAAGASCTVVVRFSPAAAGAKSATLTAGGQSNTVTLSGTGLGGTAAALTPSPFDFGNVTVGQSSGRLFTLTNNSSVGIITTTSLGPAVDFVLDGMAGTCPPSLAGGASCTLGVRFQPGSVGVKTTTLTVGANLASATLTGTGGGAAAAITNLVVSDTTPGGDGIPNNQQWSVQSKFAAGAVPFGDRTVTIETSDPALDGKDWIRTAADSKSFTSSPASFTLNGTTVFLLADDRWKPGAKPDWLDTSYSSAGFQVTVLDGAAHRPYNVWKKTVAPGSTVVLPKIGLATAPCYFVVVQ